MCECTCPSNSKSEILPLLLSVNVTLFGAETLQRFEIIQAYKKYISPTIISKADVLLLTAPEQHPLTVNLARKYNKPVFATESGLHAWLDAIETDYKKLGIKQCYGCHAQVFSTMLVKGI